MIKQFFDFKLGSYDTTEDIDLEEAAQADIVEIRGFVKGGIYHSHYMHWIGNLNGVTDPKQIIRSKKERKVTEENRAWFEKQGYRFEIVKMTRELFNEFYDLYQKTTLDRERPLKLALKEQILGKVFIEKPVWLIGLFKRKKLESGLVFSVSDDNEATVSFGAKKKFDVLRGGVGGVLEHMLIEYCLENGVTSIIHGKSRNPSGVVSKSGVFEFKARYGFSAFPMGYWKTTFIINPEVVLSDLVFVSMIKGKVGYIIVSDNTSEKVQKKYLTREVEHIQHFTFEHMRKAAKKFLKG